MLDFCCQYSLSTKWSQQRSPPPKKHGDPRTVLHADSEPSTRAIVGQVGCCSPKKIVLCHDTDHLIPIRAKARWKRALESTKARSLSTSCSSKHTLARWLARHAAWLMTRHNTGPTVPAPAVDTLPPPEAPVAGPSADQWEAETCLLVDSNITVQPRDPSGDASTEANIRSASSSHQPMVSRAEYRHRATSS